MPRPPRMPKYKDDFQKDRCSQLAKAGMPVMPRPRNSKIQRRLSKISLLSVGEGGNAGDAAAQNERVYVVRALVRVHRLQVHHVSALGYSDFHNLMGFHQQKGAPTNSLKND
jgi:hypothetical protein